MKKSNKMKMRRQLKEMEYPDSLDDLQELRETFKRQAEAEAR